MKPLRAFSGESDPAYGEPVYASMVLAHVGVSG